MDLLLQSLSAFPLFYGIWQTGNNRLRGPVMTFIAEFFTTTVGIMHGVWSLILIGLVLFIIQGRNAYKWHKEGKPW